MHKFDWPTLNEVIDCETLQMVYKLADDQASTYFTEIFARLSDSSKRELHNTETDLALPHRKWTVGQKRFSQKGSKVWNDLCTDVKSS